MVFNLVIIWNWHIGMFNLISSSSFMVYLHCRTRTWIPTQIQTPNPMVTLHRTENVPIARTYDSFTLTEMDFGTESDLDPKPDGYFVLCRTLPIAQTLIPTPYFWTGQECESESTPESISGNINELLDSGYPIITVPIFGTNISIPGSGSDSKSGNVNKPLHVVFQTPDLFSGELIERQFLSPVGYSQYVVRLVSVQNKSTPALSSLLSLGCLKARLHQAPASTLRQPGDDASDTVLIENNGVTRKWVATPIWRTPLFSMGTVLLALL